MKKLKSLLIALAAMFMLLAPQAAEAAAFTDVPANQYYSTPVSWAVEKNVTSGTSSTTFSPGAPCTRGQIVTFLYHVYGNGEISPAASFSDVEDGKYYSNAVNWAVAHGIASGKGSSTFAPNAPCTRGEAVTFLYNAAGSKVNSTSASRFSDVSTSKFYYTPVGWAVDNGITTGTGSTTFSPNNTCSRGQIVTFLYNAVNPGQRAVRTSFDPSEVPAYAGQPYAVVNNDVPFFSSSDLTTTAFENYSDLDSLGRCGVAYANVCQEIMPTTERENIGSVEPTGWHSVKYDGIDGDYLYNRCHLIGYQLSAENANAKNLITGTRYLNVEGMLPFENMVADYVKETNNHVLYRVMPVFEGNNLLASGVLMEAESVEDKGAGILFCVYCYNVQPGITINYADGSSSGPAYTGSSSGSSTGTSSASGFTVAGTSGTTSSSTAASAASGSSKTSSTSVSDASETPSDSTMVWVSATGSKYHSIPNCGRMNPNKAHQETKAQAVAEGLSQCSKCW